MLEETICFSAPAQHEAGREEVLRRFWQLLEEHDIFVTKEAFASDGMGEEDSFTLTCHLQAPTIYDVSVRLAKAGWMYSDATENRAAPCLTGPAGERVRISREETCAKMMYTLGTASGWATRVRRMMAARDTLTQTNAAPARLDVYQNTGS